MKEFFKAILYTPLFNLLVFFAWLVPGHSMGWSIILLTIVVRAALWLPTMKSLRMPLQLRQYQDDIKAIQERHKDDRAAQTQATMAFYREKGINPLAGCLPLLIQLPILIILYQVFITGLNDLRPDLLYSFTPHLGAINAHFLGIDLSKSDHIFLPTIAAILQFLQARHQQRMNPSVGNDPASTMMRQMTYLFPLMTYFIARSLPAGLPLYWATTTGISWLQQIYVTKTFVATKPKVSVTVREKKK